MTKGLVLGIAAVTATAVGAVIYAATKKRNPMLYYRYMKNSSK